MRGWPLFPWVLVLVALSQGCDTVPVPPVGEAGGVPAASGIPEKLGAGGEPSLGDGFLVWESNRSGAWRIWARSLDPGDLPRQLTPDEPGRQHYAPHISIDGRAVAYLSLEDEGLSYPEDGGVGELRLIPAQGGEPRVLAERARTYFENRAVVWRTPTELIFIGEDLRTYRLDVETGEKRPLTVAPASERGYLINAQLSYASGNRATFSVYDAERRRIVPRTDLGGCQPYFSHDGRWGVWTGGAGGPIQRMDLESRRIETLIDKNDSRLGGGWGYLYFPMPSRDGTLLALAASRNEHDHFKSDYEIFVFETDPETLDPIGDGLRFTHHPATDRYPDVYREPMAPGRRRVVAPGPRRVQEARVEVGAPSWPVSREGLVFVWQTGKAPNLVPDPETGVDRAVVLAGSGTALLDHDWAMTPGAGQFGAEVGDAARLRRDLQGTNKMSLEITLKPGRRAGRTDVVSFASNRRQNFRLELTGRRLFFHLRTGNRGPEANTTIELFELPGERSSHVVVTYSPAQLSAYLDGERRIEIGPEEIRGDFFHWRDLPLTFGGGRSAGLRLEGVAIYDRVLSGEEVAANFSRFRSQVAGRPRVPQLVVEARLLGRTPAPRLEQISPYREALVVYEYEVVRLLAGEIEADRLRVAHWAILDGRPLALSDRRVGEIHRLRVEAFDANPQLASLYLGQAETIDAELPLFYSPSVPE